MRRAKRKTRAKLIEMKFSEECGLLGANAPAFCGENK